MDKTFYIVTVSDGTNKYSYAFQIFNFENMWPVIQTLSQICIVETMNACRTKKEAVATVDAWNKTWKEKGIFWEDRRVLPCWIYA